MSRYLKWLLPLFLIVLFTPFSSKMDLGMARYFFKGGHFFDNTFTQFMYRYGEWIGLLFGVISTLLFFISYYRWKHLRKVALAMMLTLLFGAGLLINSTLKEYWGRPRPKQVIAFGGTQEFRPYYKPHFHSDIPMKSFPSGHVAMGFYYLTLCLVAHKEGQKKLFYLGLGLTLFFGIGLFFTRIAQGGHFFSDGLFSIVIMWYSALLAHSTSEFLLKYYLKEEGIFGRWVTFPKRFFCDLTQRRRDGGTQRK